MYDFLNALLLQRRTIFVIVTTIDAASINVQLVFFFKFRRKSESRSSKLIFEKRVK
jgi:hypothetical protein